MNIDRGSRSYMAVVSAANKAVNWSGLNRNLNQTKPNCSVWFDFWIEVVEPNKVWFGSGLGFELTKPNRTVPTILFITLFRFRKSALGVPSFFLFPFPYPRD